MEKIKSLSQKLTDGSFSEAIPFGADAINIDLAEGKNLEEKIAEMDNKASGRAPTYHASSAEIYGLASDKEYGHVKITDTYTLLTNNGKGQALSQKAANEIYRNYLAKELQVFYVLNDEILFSIFSTGWQRDNISLNLVSDYFKIEEIEDGHYKLTVKNIHGQIIE